MHIPFMLVPAQAGSPGSPSSMLTLLPLLLVFVVLYLLILRPQAKRQKQRDAMLKKVQKGDRIVTTGGIYGTVVSTRGDDVLVVKIADNVRVDMARPAVAAIVGQASEAQQAEA